MGSCRKEKQERKYENEFFIKNQCGHMGTFAIFIIDLDSSFKSYQLSPALKGLFRAADVTTLPPISWTSR